MLSKKIVLANGLLAELLYDETLVKMAIEKNWESLFFPENNVTFAKIKCRGEEIILDTTGQIKIFDKENMLSNENSEEIKMLLEDVNFDHAFLNIVENNWFAIRIVGYDDDLVFEMTPKSMEDFFHAMKSYADYFFIEVIGFQLDPVNLGAAKLKNAIFMTEEEFLRLMDEITNYDHSVSVDDGSISIDKEDIVYLEEHFKVCITSIHADAFDQVGIWIIYE